MTHQKTNLILIIFTVFISFFQGLKAQERRDLRGRILVDSLENASGVHVINLNAETGTSTNAQGQFIISAREGDSIFFSSVQFENRNVIIKESDFEKLKEIKLIRKFNELDEVQLDDIKLSGVLASDINKVPKSIYEKLGMPFPKPRRSSLELAIQSASGGGPLVSVLNQLNGKAEQLEKAKKNNELTILVNKGLRMVGESYFVNQLGISENEVINFLFYCTDYPSFKKLVDTESVLKLIEFFETKVDSFKELRELD